MTGARGRLDGVPLGEQTFLDLSGQYGVIGNERLTLAAGFGLWLSSRRAPRE